MDVKSAFLYETIEEEVYVCQPPGFEDCDYPDKIYVDDIIFGSTNKDLCKAFEKLMKDKFQMNSMGELTFFLGLQVKQKQNGIFISQDKYVAKILRIFGLTDRKSVSTPIDTEKPLLKDPDGEDVDVHTYRLMIGSLMYLTSSRPDIMFAVCACARFQVTPKASHLHAVKRIFIYLKGKPHLGFWYPKDSPFNLVAYSDSDYAGASLARKSTTEGCQFFGCRLIFWQCKIKHLLPLHPLRLRQTTTGKENSNPFMAGRKKAIITEATIREALRLDDAESIDCLPNEEIFTELSRMGYEKPSTKLTFYKAFFSPQWNLVRIMDSSTKFYMYPRFLQLMIRTQVGDLSSHTIKYSSTALTQKVFANMRRVGKGFSRVETPLFEGMIVEQQADDVADEGVAGVDVDDVPAAVEPSIPSPTPTTQPPPPSQELPSTSQGEIIANMDADEDVILKDVVVVAKEVVVKKDTEIEENADVQGRQAESQAQIYQIDLEHADKEKEENVVIRYEALKRKPQTEAQARKNMMIYLRNMAGFKMEYFKGMSYDDIRLIFKKYFNSNVAFLEKTKELLEEEESRALKRNTESQAEKGAKKQKLDEEVEELKKHLQIVPNDEDDVYTKATPLARKVHVIDYEIYTKNNKPYYKIIRADGSPQLFLSFLSLLRNFDREDLEVLWQLVKERFASSKPKNFSDDFLLTTLTYMFEKLDVQAQVWKNQRTVHGLKKVKSWRLLESSGVHIITFTTT
nr:hypothetical protein [Tanacetum cinerariifolium]